MEPHPTFRRRKDARRLTSEGSSGQALAEFSLVVVVLFLAFFAIIDLGRAVAIHAATITASREAARYGSAVGDNGSGVFRYVDCPGIRAAARAKVGALLDLSDNEIRISYDNGAGASTTQACPPHGSGPVAAEIDQFDRVVVEVVETYEFLTPVQALIGPVTIESIDRRAIVKTQ